ncbi:hypothetical protein EVAR_59821_1 [Eumeta japonica]|uniref:Uncharacterized protein n=1 Tax=Eumeta variegata TaxID=151549 RepID=A0A4C1ZEN8_EUMVA|nr:hypothetical protein EVAR_59821_1 [Eumeta japonica]
MSKSRPAVSVARHLRDTYRNKTLSRFVRCCVAKQVKVQRELLCELDAFRFCIGFRDVGLSLNLRRVSICSFALRIKRTENSTRPRIHFQLDHDAAAAVDAGRGANRWTVELLCPTLTCARGSINVRDSSAAS